MTAISQRISNFLLGVSQQTDDQKRPGQVRELINGYPDPTFGLIKRPGTKFVAELKDSTGAVITPATISGAKFFTIYRDNQEKYLVALITGQTNSANNSVKVWKLTDGSPVTVNYGTNAKLYLTNTKVDYQALTVNDYTFITNTKKTVTALAAPSFTYGKSATIRVLNVEYSAQYKVTVNGQVASTITKNSDTPGSTPERILNYEDILDALKTAIDGKSISGLTVTKVGSALELSCTSPFTIDVIGGRGGDALSVFQDTVDNISRLPQKSVNGRIVKIANTNANQDDYYVKYVADSAGNGYWEETIAPFVSPGLDTATMPHQLVREANGTFTFKQSEWEPRLVGDLTSNPDPSFVGETITQVFFYNNRFGMLSSDNIVLSQSGDFFNFFSQSGLTSIASDPVDISCSSVRPAVLTAVVPVAQGLVLFSRSQQFLVTADNGILTPQTTSIKSISNYELDTSNMPVDMGTTISFISKISSYTRVFEMETRGQEYSPVVVDISRGVPEWIPSTIDQVVSSPQNSLLSLGSSSSNTLYLFRFYFNGESREIQSWFKWQLPGIVLHHSVFEDIMWSVTQQANAIVLQRIDLIQSPDSSTIQSKEGVNVDPRLDLWTLNPTRSYNSTTKISKVYLPYKHDPSLNICLVIGNKITQGSTFLDIGQIQLPTTVSQDGGGYYVSINDIDLTNSEIILGYTFLMDVFLPAIYARLSSDDTLTDYTGSLVISRIKISTGLGGELNFLIQARGREDWQDLLAVTDANTYVANDVPLVDSRIHTIPLHQKPSNMKIKIQASGPFPVSLLSMVWEGQYSGRFYTRK
jgi:hypothetical protein